MLGEAAMPLTRLVEVPGRGTTRVWECPGPPGAETVVLIHGVACTAELNWGKVFAPLARHFRVVAADLRGHGDGIALRSRFRLEDCADDIAALAGVLGIGRFTAVGYSMGGMVAQLMYRRHPALLSGLVLCSTAGNVSGSPAEQLAALGVPAVAAALRWNPMLNLMGAELFGMALIGPIDDPATGRWVRAQLHRTTLATAVSATTRRTSRLSRSRCFTAKSPSEKTFAKVISATCSNSKMFRARKLIKSWPAAMRNWKINCKPRAPTNVKLFPNGAVSGAITSAAPNRRLNRTPAWK